MLKVLILAGGIGSRLSEETDVTPKPMVQIGGKPMLWHIMKIYSAHGLNDFVILCGHKSYVIKEYFSNYFLHMSDVTIDLENNRMHFHRQFAEPWRITLLETGLDTMTGGRLKRAADYLGDGPFCFTYGDGVSDVNVTELIKYHKSHGKLATVTAMRHTSRFGLLEIEDQRVTQFQEKPVATANRLNSGFFVLEPAVLDYIDGDHIVFEQEPIGRLVEQGQLHAFEHDGFFAGLDTLRDKMALERMWQSGQAPWKIWDDNGDI